MFSQAHLNPAFDVFSWMGQAWDYSKYGPTTRGWAG